MHFIINRKWALSVKKVLVLLSCLSTYSTELAAQQQELYQEVQMVEEQVLTAAQPLRYVRFEEKGKFGFRTSKGEVLLPAEYDQLPSSPFSFMLVRKNGEYGVINQEVKQLLPFGRYQQLVLEQGYRLGPTDERGITWVPEMEQIALLAQKEGAFGLVNPFGKVLVPLEYEIGKFAGETYFLLFKERKWWLFDAAGRLILPNGMDWVRRVPGGLVIAQGAKEGFWRPPNEWVLPLEYDEIRPDVHYPILHLTKAGKTESFNPRTNLFTKYEGPAIRLVYTLPLLGKKAPYYLLRSSARDRYGLGHVQHGSLLPPVYNYIYPLHQFSLFGAKMDGKTALFDSLGHQLTPFSYSLLVEIPENPAFLMAQMGIRYSLLQISDFQLQPTEGYDRLFVLKNGCFSASDGNLLALINKEGLPLTAHRYVAIAPPTSAQLEWAASQKQPKKLLAVATLESLQLRGIDEQGNEYKLSE